MRRPVRGLVALACLPVLLGALAACGDDAADASTDPVEVEVGKAFEWNGFSVDEGWTLTGVKRSAGAEEVTTPDVRGTITNDLDEERAALFQMVFSSDGDPLATVNCSAAKLQRDESTQFECPGLGAVMPTDYDAVVVQEFVR
ncbi:MAG: hypothetical protein ACKOVB_12830 [Terrabacter sp.]